jgi:hypothetical protein
VLALIGGFVALTVALMVVGGVGAILSRSTSSTAQRTTPPSVSTFNGTHNPPATRALVPPTSTPASLPPVSPTGNWQRSEERSKMNDSRIVTYMLSADDIVEGWLAKERPTLIARCKEGSIDVYIVTGMASSVESGGSDRHTVQVRYDDQVAQAQQWSESTDNKAMFSRNGRSALRSIALAKRFRFGFTPFNASPQIAEFNVEGFSGPYSEIVAACATSTAPIKRMQTSLADSATATLPAVPVPARYDYSTSPNRDELVYVYDGATIYHRKDCVAMAGRKNVHAVPLGTLTNDFDPCGTCRPPK